MFDELMQVTKEVASVVLTIVNCLAFAVAASGDVELPLSVGKHLVILVKWAEKYLR
jgi:hypothetical protein